MEILQIVGIGITASVIIVILRVTRPEIAIQVSIVTGVVILLMLLGKITSVIKLLEEYSSRVGINKIYFQTLLKITGIAYIAEFGAEICRDAGESAIASKIELGGKVIIMTLAVPILTSLLELVISILP